MAAVASPDTRPDLYVVARFLDKLWHEEGTPPPRWSKSRLQPAVRVNYDVFRRYLDVLRAHGFVDLRAGEHGGSTVLLTEAGRRAHAQLVGWLRATFGPSALEPRSPPTGVEENGNHDHP